MTRPLAFATYEKLPSLTSDDQLAVAALAERGIPVRAAAWGDLTVDWSAFSAVVIRSCWDYHLRPERFKDWLHHLEQLGLPVWNPTEVLCWNMDKHYLSDLQAAGISVTPSVWLPGGTRVNLADLLASKGWKQAVIKPTISASAYRTHRVALEAVSSIQGDFDAMNSDGAVLVQAYLDVVEDPGEWSLMFFDRQYSHAVLKRPQPGDFRVQAEYGGSTQTVAALEPLIEQAQGVLDELDGPLLYARVDGVEREGKFVLMELELIEPHLFFEDDPQAPGRFAAALERLTQVEVGNP